MKTREVSRVIPGQATTDGAGVRIQRTIGANPQFRLDPFLMLDEFYSDDPGDYIAGFPSHPHRGFETVTYMLDGHMRHEDHMGNQGDLQAGDVQWMTAARGIIHSEMPQQAEGRMRGFQLWINLPAAEKMKPASWRDVPKSNIPEIEFDGGVVHVIAGILDIGGKRTEGPISGLATEPFYFDVRLSPGGAFDVPLPLGHAAFVYLYEGGARAGETETTLPFRSAAVLGDGHRMHVGATDEGASFLLLAGKPLNEPVVQYGPFVMNTREEIERALADYRDGTLVSGVQ